MEGWEHKPLGSICSIARGGSPRPIQQFLTDAPDGVNWIKISDATASGRYIYRTAEKIKPAGVARSRLVKDGDFLLSNSMSFGRPYIMRTSGCIHDGWLVLSDYQETFDQTFLYYVLGSPQVFSQFDRLAAGSTVRNLNIDLASRVVVPAPPLPEQRRIVAILDEAFEAIATAKVNTEKNLQNGRSVFNSLLNSMFASSDWQRKTIGELFRVGSSKRVLKSQWQSQGIPFYRGREVTRLAKDGFVDNELFISEALYAELSSKYGVPNAGDIMVTAIGTIGNAYVVRQGDHFYFKDASVLWLKKITDLSSDFINYWLRSDQFFEQLNRGSGATVDTLTIQKLQSVTLKLPSLSEQRRIVAKLDALADSTERLEELYGGKLAALNELKNSLLHQAFTGKLTAKSIDQQLEAVA